MIIFMNLVRTPNLMHHEIPEIYSVLSHRLESTVCTLVLCPIEMLPSHFQRLAQDVSKHGINLNDRVDRDETFRPLHSGHAIVYKGTISPEGTRVAVKSLRLAPSADKAAGNVHALHCDNICPPN